MVSIARLCFPMLHYHAIPIAVKSLLLEISPLLLETSYYLAGGTSVALRYGHRLSVDLDYFTEQPLEKEIILSLLAEADTVDSSRMLSIKDVAAMKINAICNRGSKKDFFDIKVLLKTFTLREMLDFYQKKYVIGNRFMAIRSLVWFEDADSEPDPESLDGSSWEAVKNLILEEVSGL
jgi:hypothetical protein